jgi:multicomponent Na+:H+ antiporter subunit D
MIGNLPPAFVLILGALLIPLLPGKLRSAYLLALPVLSFLHFVGLPRDYALEWKAFDFTLTVVRIDKLSFVFGVIFHIAAFLSVIYALHVKEALEHVAAMVYVGAAIGALFAGDLITLFVYWELTALSSVFLIWARRTPQAYKAGLRYLAVQVASGVILLAGLILHYRHTRSISFGLIGLQPGDPGTYLIFIAFGIKCAFPLLHNWLQDAYPEATVTGTVFLSAFTTKLAVYALARGFPGTEILVPIGAAMTAFPIFYAVIEDDLRRVLAYSLNNQLGFMVVGIGIGTPMALNGTASHAFAHILYKALLFMSMGAVLFRTGKINGSELGGLYKSMPLTAVFCMIGAASISSFPLTSGFVSKSLVIDGAAQGHYVLTWLVLLFASAGVFHHSGIKIPFFAFYAHDSGIRCKEAPANMLLAMGLAAALCIGIGVYPQPLYDILPHRVDFAPYKATHVVTQLQLLFFSGLAFTFLKKTGIYPPELRATNLDTDWFYRRLPKLLWQGVGAPALAGLARCEAALRTGLPRLLLGAPAPGGAIGRLPRPWAVSRVVVVVMLTLVVYLLFVFSRSR